MKKLVLLLNMGGANSLDDVEIFLKNMFNDPHILGIKSNFWRKILAKFITKMRLKSAKENYKQIGGKSPISDITENLCKKLNSSQSELIFDYAMNYTAPFCKDVLSNYKNIDEIIVLPLYPHHSITTITSSLKDFHKAYNELNLNARVREMGEFYNSKEYNEIIIKSIELQTKNENLSDISLIFSAHSLPQKIINNGDKYETQIKKHVEILAQNILENGLNFKDIKLAYQSRLGPIKWLEPSLNSVLEKLENKKAIIYPLSFCIDNSESVFELDIEYRHLANKLDFKFYKVCKCPNDSDEFINFIKNYIKE